jgi:hypothetical protein
VVPIDVLQSGTHAADEFQIGGIRKGFPRKHPTAHHDAFCVCQGLSERLVVAVLEGLALVPFSLQPIGQQGVNAIDEGDPHGQEKRPYMRWPTVK